jgi:UDP-glucose 4-epimerase
VKILVTGGAGYIGAHVGRLLRQRGDTVVVIDDLVTGFADRVSDSMIVQIDLASDDAPAQLERVLRVENIDAVVHLAARKQVGESVERAAWYYQQNIGSLATVLIAMQAADVHRLVFSSSAAVYGRADGLVGEDAQTVPINPYGETKLAGEWLVDAATRSFPLRATSLRYFNVAGAGWPELGDRAVLNLIPMVFAHIDRAEPPLIFGDDYDTPDGTCVRDYVHVLDLAEAHLAALDRLPAAGSSHSVYNVGGGCGSSVREVIDEILVISGSQLVPQVRPRRVGDPSVVVARPERIERDLGWTASRNLRQIIESAWEAHLGFSDSANV